MESDRCNIETCADGTEKLKTIAGDTYYASIAFRQNTRLYPAIDFYERALGFDRKEPPEDRFERFTD